MVCDSTPAVEGRNRVPPEWRYPHRSLALPARFPPALHDPQTWTVGYAPLHPPYPRWVDRRYRHRSLALPARLTPALHEPRT